MASLDDPTYSPRNPSFALRENKFFRSRSSREPSFSGFNFSPNSLSQSLHNSPVSTPLHHVGSPKLTDHLHAGSSSYKCTSSVLKKDGQILSTALFNNVIYTGSDSNLIRIWKLPEFTECGQIKTKACRVFAIQVCNDRVYAAYGDGKIRVWRRTWGRVLKHVRLGTIPTGNSYIRSYIAAKHRMVKHMGPITSMALNMSNGILYSASLDKTVKVWRISDLKCIETIQAHSDPINAIICADDGILYTASDDATVKVWRWNLFCGDMPRSHSQTTTLPAKDSPVKTLTQTPDGALLYGGCNDGYVHYWLKGWFSGQMQYGGALQGHTHGVMCLASVANYVVSGSADSTCRVWTRDSDGQHVCLAVLLGHRGPIRCVAAFFWNSEEESEDGCTICSGSLDGILKVWRVLNKDNTKRGNESTYFELQKGL